MVYVTDVNNNTVSVIDGKTNTVTATVPVGHLPADISVNPSTNMVYVANNGVASTSTQVSVDGKTE